MNGNSKQEKVASFVKRAVHRALQDLAWDFPDDALKIRQHASSIEIRVAFEMTANPYIFREVKDIMAWKQPPDRD